MQQSGLRVLVPPRHAKNLKGPLIFLAGPIQSAINWQAMAIRYFRSLAGCRAMEFKKKFPHGLTIASPRRQMELDGDFDDKKFNQQVDWEHFYLDYAAKHGVTLFWLPKAVKEIPGRAYAQTSRFELGEAMARHRSESAKLVVGIAPEFSGARYIERTLKLKAPTVNVSNSMAIAMTIAWDMLARK